MRHNNRSFSKTAYAVCISLAHLFVSGCSKSNELETARVHGTVTVQGKPLSSGSVTFVPERGRFATGEIKADGTYKLKTYVEADGASVGKHRVKITALESKKTMNRENDEPVKSLIPERYGVESTSGLTYEVKSGQYNVANFDLQAK